MSKTYRRGLPDRGNYQENVADLPQRNKFNQQRDGHYRPDYEPNRDYRKTRGAGTMNKNIISGLEDYLSRDVFN